MVNFAISNIFVNKLLSTAKGNLGKFIIFLGLITLQGVLSAFTYAGLMALLISHVLGGNPLDWGGWALLASFVTAFFVESLVLAFHLADLHKQALAALVAVGLVGFLKMIDLAFPVEFVFSMGNVILGLTITILSILTPFGVYYLCKGMAEDSQLRKVHNDGISLENSILSAENEEDALYITKIELKARSKKTALEARYILN